jgi:hypothetical protein
MRFALVALLAVSAVAAGQTATAPVFEVKHPSPEVDAILDRLESRGESIEDLQAKLTFRQQDLVVDDTLTKRGTICFRRDEPNASFAIIFEFPQDKRELYLFDGRWFTEVNERTKTYQRHEVVREGESIDPFRIGQGPFPLPFGQKKADILTNFDVTLVESSPTDPPDTVHLCCIPRAGTQMADTHKRLDFFISQKGATKDLPIRLIDNRKGQKRDTIDFAEAKLNSGVPGSRFTYAKPKASGGWQVFEDDTLPPIQDEP